MTVRPDYVYRILTRDEWRAAQQAGEAPYGDLDRRDGFLHLSLKETVLETAGLYFTGRDDLVALEIFYPEIEKNCRLELAPARGALFPHLYGRLPMGAVRRVLILQEEAPGRFVFGGVAQ